MKFTAGMKHGVNHTFSVMISSLDNPYAINKSMSISINFAGPQINDSVPNDMAASKCEKLDLDSTAFVT